jgi:hypothetical protein
MVEVIATAFVFCKHDAEYRRLNWGENVNFSCHKRKLAVSGVLVMWWVGKV